MRNPAEVLIKPVISEKTYALAEENKFVFFVDKSANKIEIRNAVEKQFDVKVSRVNTMTVKGKIKKQGKTSGKRPDRKKAIVTLTEGTIEIFEGI